MEQVHCDTCDFTWLSPKTLEAAVRHEVAVLIRSGDAGAARRRLREMTGLGIYDAKNVESHVTREPGKCHQCGAVLSGRNLAACPECRSLNYDW